MVFSLFYNKSLTPPFMLFSFQILKYADILIKKIIGYMQFWSAQRDSVSGTPALSAPHLADTGTCYIRDHYKYTVFLCVGSVQLNRKDSKLRQLNTNDKNIK